MNIFQDKRPFQNQSPDLSDPLKVELKNDSLQFFDAKWSETMIALRKQPDEEVLDKMHPRQRDKLDQIKELLALYIRDTVEKAEPKNHSLSRGRLRDNLAAVVAAREIVNTEEDKFAVSSMTQPTQRKETGK